MSTIAAIATPNASGGIGVIRISGDDAIAVADKVFRAISEKKLCDIKGYTALFGHIYENESAIDECVALVFRAPKSYTGEDVVELSCHGGLYVTQKVLRTVFAAGAIPAQPGEFTKRAFLNGKIDLAQAESIMNIISAHGQQALNAAANTLDGKLSEKIAGIAASLTNVAAGIAVWTDDPDEDVPQAHEENVYEVVKNSLAELTKLIKNFDSGKAVTQGVPTAICGHPNVGKSTLMNQLAGYDKSIVTDIAGTTRDVVEETVRLGDIVLHLADTAGIHESDDIVESIGIDRTMKKLDSASLVLAVFDSSQPLDSNDLELLERCKGRKAVAIINKTDLGINTDIDKIKEFIADTVFISAANGDGIEDLKTVIEELLGTAEFDTSAGILANERQYACCTAAAESLREAITGLEIGVTLDAVNVSIDYAVEKLLELTGEKAREAVVNEVFSKFCVGK